MREVSQTEAIQTLPSLLEEAQTHPIGVAGENGKKAFLVSPEAYQDVRAASLRRMWVIADSAGARVEEHAAQLGITTEELVARLLED